MALYPVTVISTIRTGAFGAGAGCLLGYAAVRFRGNHAGDVLAISRMPSVTAFWLWGICLDLALMAIPAAASAVKLAII